MNVFAQRVFHNGLIYTMNEQAEQAKQIAVYDGKIVAIDEAVEAMIGPQTEMIDLQGKAMIPGIIESHAHPLTYATNQLGLNLKPNQVDSVADILEKVRERAKSTPKGEWILGAGWDDILLAEKRPPTIEELNEAAPEHPVYLVRTCVHNAVANQLAFEASGLSLTPTDPAGGHFVINPATKQVSGLVQENAMDLFNVPKLSTEQQVAAMIEAQKQFFKWGITTIHDMATTPQLLAIYQQLRKKEDFKMKVRMWIWALDQMGWIGREDEVIDLGLESGFGDDYLNIQGLKYMLDGSVGGRTAAVAESYEGEEDNVGILYMPQEKITKHIQKAIRANLRVSIHGIGERALDMAIAAITESASPEKNQAMRNRIEHVTLVTQHHLEKMREHAIVAASSVGFIYSIGDSYIKNLGPERAERVFPHKTFKEYGLVAPGNSDLPVCDGNPMYGIYAAVTRKTVGGQQMGTKETISIEDAMKAYTMDAAYSGFDEKIIGSIEVGKYADLVVLEQNPFMIDVDTLKDVEVSQTYVEGQLVYEK